MACLQQSEVHLKDSCPSTPFNHHLPFEGCCLTCEDWVLSGDDFQRQSCCAIEQYSLAAGSKAKLQTQVAVRAASYKVIHATIGLPSKEYSF